MADVDFSNAVLDVYLGNPLNRDNYLYIYATGNLTDLSGNIVTSNFNKSIISNTPSKVSILFSGGFATSGTEFYISRLTSGGVPSFAWKVSNISFSSGDTYSFIIDIETSGNT